MTQVRDKTLILGHRGNGSGRDENTLVAFREALKLGAAGVELDIWKCKSGEFIVRHDPTIDGSAFITQRSLSEIRESSIADILLLPEVLHELRPCVINIEIKNVDSNDDRQDATSGIVRSLRELVHDYTGKFVFIFSTFDKDLAIRLEDLTDIGNTALLVGIRSKVSSSIAFCEQHKISGIHLHWRSLTRRTLRILVQSNLEFSLWTVNSPSAISANLNRGARFLITDNVSTAVEIAGQASIAM